MIAGLIHQTRPHLIPGGGEHANVDFWRPGTGVPREPRVAAPRPAPPVRLLLVAVAVAAGTAFLYSVSAPAVSAFRDIVSSGTGGPVTPASRDEVQRAAAMNIAFILLAAIVLICLFWCTDNRTVGLARAGRDPHHRVALGSTCTRPVR